MTAEKNYRLLREIEANRKFILMACRQNPKLLDRAEGRIKPLFAMPTRRESREAGAEQVLRFQFVFMVGVCDEKLRSTPVGAMRCARPGACGCGFNRPCWPGKAGSKCNTRCPRLRPPMR